MRTATKARLFFLTVLFSTILGSQVFAEGSASKELVADLVALTGKVDAGSITSATAFKAQAAKLASSMGSAAVLADNHVVLFNAIKSGTITQATLKEFQASAGSISASQLVTAITNANSQGIALTSTNLAKLAVANQTAGTGMPTARPATAANDVFATSATGSEVDGVLKFDCRGVASCVTAQKSVLTSSGTAINPSAANLTAVNRLFAAAGAPLVKACGGDGACVTDGLKFVGNFVNNPAGFVANEKSVDLGVGVLTGTLAAEGAVAQNRLTAGAQQAAASCGLRDTRPACLCLANGKGALASNLPALKP